jgi:hypothetical protein
VIRRTASRHSLLDAILRDIGPALDAINAASLASAEKKLLVRRLIQSRLEHVGSAQDCENAGKPPQP